MTFTPEAVEYKRLSNYLYYFGGSLLPQIQALSRTSEPLKPSSLYVRRVYPYLSIYLSVYLSIYLSIHINIHIYTFVRVYIYI